MSVFENITMDKELITINFFKNNIICNFFENIPVLNYKQVISNIIIQ